MTRTALATDDPQPADWLSTRDAARLLGVTPRRLYGLIGEGAIPAYRMGRVIRLRRADVAEYLRDTGDS